MTRLQQELLDRVQAGMDRHGYTQSELSLQSGVAQGNLSKMLRGLRVGSLSSWDALLRVVEH